MKKLVYTDKIGFDMSDWLQEPIEKVFSGFNSIMAVTSDGRTLQKVREPAKAVRTAYWTRIEEISISLDGNKLTIGLVKDGTCIISKQALREICYPGSRNHYSFDDVHRIIKSWKNIVQVQASDSFFALDASGRVHVAPLSCTDEEYYRDVASWRNVRRIVAGDCCSILGITNDGHVLCAGSSLKNGYPAAEMAKSLSHVIDIATSGSDCDILFYAFEDGSAINSQGQTIPVKTASSASQGKILDGLFYSDLIVLNEHHQLVRYNYFKGCSPLFPEEGEVVSFATGVMDFRDPFVIAVVETGAGEA